MCLGMHGELNIHMQLDVAKEAWMGAALVLGNTCVEIENVDIQCLLCYQFCSYTQT